jgi:hypothetical protein
MKHLWRGVQCDTQARKIAHAQAVSASPLLGRRAPCCRRLRCLECQLSLQAALGERFVVVKGAEQRRLEVGHVVEPGTRRQRLWSARMAHQSTQVVRAGLTDVSRVRAAQNWHTVSPCPPFPHLRQPRVPVRAPRHRRDGQDGDTAGDARCHVTGALGHTLPQRRRQLQRPVPKRVLRRPFRGRLSRLGSLAGLGLRRLQGVRPPGLAAARGVVP